MSFFIHPLFFIFGLYFAFIGKVFSFLTFTLVALIHELAHSYIANNLGYKLKKITLMPYGAIVSGDMGGMTYIDEIKISFAGPIINLILGLLTMAIWWIEPESYPYTEGVVTANLTLFIINLLPCFPLDCGRILLATLSLYMPRKKSLFICKVVGVVCSASLLAMFIISCFTTINISILFFSLFMLLGNIFNDKNNSYVRLYQGMQLKNIKGGKVIKKVVLSESRRVIDIIRLMNNNLIEVVIVDDFGNIKSVLDIQKTLYIINNADYYSTLSLALCDLNNFNNNKMPTINSTPKT